jgi:hypothetical protein
VLPTLNIAVRVEFMACHVPSQAGNETSEDFETLFVSFTLINSHKYGHSLLYLAPDRPDNARQLTQLLDNCNCQEYQPDRT